MAKDTEVLIKVVGVNDTDKATTEAIDNIEKVGKATKRTSKDAQKDWQGVTNLFSSVLPRGLQRSMRQFKSTTRSVGRLSKSFKVLKTAWASIGIGLIIIALEQIIENWDKITESLGFYNAEAERTKEINIEQNKAVSKLNAETKGYIQLLKNSTSSTEQQAEAVDFLNKKFGDYIDTEANVEKQVKQVTEVMAQREAVIKAQIEVASRQADFEEKNYVKTEKRVKAEKGFFENITEAQIRLFKEEQDARYALEAATLILTTANSEYNKIIGEGTDREDGRAAAVRKRLEDEKIAAKIRADLARQAEADANYLADLEKRVSEEIMLAKIEDDLLRAEKELELRHEEMLEKAWFAGATAEQLLLIEDKYLLDLADLKESYKEDDIDEGKTPEQIVQEQQALQDEMFLLLMEEQEREETLIMQRYDRRNELANGNRQLEKDAKKLFDAEMEALTEDSEKKKQAIKEAGIKATVNAARGLFSTMGKMAEDGSEQAKALAITDVLLAQAVALANGIKVASKAAKDPWTLLAGIIASISAVMGAFVGVKAILNEAGASAGGGGGGGIPSTTPLVPDQVSRTETTGKAFVVQSDLEGAALQSNQLYSQTALGGG